MSTAAEFFEVDLLVHQVKREENPPVDSDKGGLPMFSVCDSLSSDDGGAGNMGLLADAGADEQEQSGEPQPAAEAEAQPPPPPPPIPEAR